MRPAAGGNPAFGVRHAPPGRRLVYSTCTLNPDENEAVFERFLREHANFVPDDFSVSVCRSRGGMYTFFPDGGESDGFFVARAVKRKERS